MLTTQYVPGSINWLDLGSPDIPTSAAFYQAVFGWDYQSMGGQGDYGALLLEGKSVGAVGTLTEAGARSAWMLYFQTADADATVKAVEQAGGTIRMPASGAEGAGRFAQLTDPAGAEFALWEPSGMRGLDLVTEVGSLTWAELYVPDPQAIRSFYQSVFDWRIDDMPMGEASYPVIAPAEGENNMMAGIAQLQPGDRPHWLPYFEVADCDATVATSLASGGSVLLPAMDLETVGRFAFLADPHGARFAVITSSP